MGPRGLLFRVPSDSLRPSQAQSIPAARLQSSRKVSCGEAEPESPCEAWAPWRRRCRSTACGRRGGQLGRHGSCECRAFLRGQSGRLSLVSGKTLDVHRAWQGQACGGCTGRGVRSVYALGTQQHDWGGGWEPPRRRWGGHRRSRALWAMRRVADGAPCQAVPRGAECRTSVGFVLQLCRALGKQDDP